MTAGPTPPTPDVINLDDHRRPPPHGEPTPGDVRTAEILEALAAHRGRTLTDPATAEAAGIALDYAMLILDGALGGGHLDLEQHEMLTALLKAARRAPTTLSPDGP